MPNGKTRTEISFAAGVAVFASTAVASFTLAVWYRITAYAGGTGPNSILGGPTEIDAWQAFSSVDYFVAIAAACAAVVSFAAFALGIPRGFWVAVVLVSIATAFVIYRIIDPPTAPPGTEEIPNSPGFAVEVERLWGLWASLVAGVLAVAGNAVAALTHRHEPS